MELQRAIAALLPADIGVDRLRKVDPGFNPRYRAKWREYRYFIWNGPPSPMRERYRLGVREPLDVEAMAAAGRVFVGTHDFSAFGGADTQPVRTVHRVRVTKRGRSVTIGVVGNAFLRQMVRRMVAALLRVGQGRATVADVEAALASVGQPAFDGDTAPAHGLVLWRVPMNYDEEQRGQRENDEQDIQPASE
jgi:tRNA pseudouridine38-40 synthase